MGVHLIDSRLERAEQLIEEGRYNEAEAILRDMSDPNAYQLARKLQALRPVKPQKSIKRELAIALVIAVVLIVGILIYTLIVSSCIQAGDACRLRFIRF